MGRRETRWLQVVAFDKPIQPELPGNRFASLHLAVNIHLHFCSFETPSGGSFWGSRNKEVNSIDALLKYQETYMREGLQTPKF